eukprot:g18945.t1
MASSRPPTRSSFPFAFRLVTSFGQAGQAAEAGTCQAYLFNEGLVRFASEAFTMSAAQLGNPCVHLTNNEVNAKHAKQNGPGQANCGNWRLSKLLKWLKDSTAFAPDNVEALWPRIRALVWEVLEAARPTIAQAVAQLPVTDRCFELFGFDVLVNSLPSLGIGGAADLEVDRAMLLNLFEILWKDISASTVGDGEALQVERFESLGAGETTAADCAEKGA